MLKEISQRLFGGHKQVANPHAPEFASYHKGPIPGINRAGYFVFNKQTLYPLVKLGGAGKTAGQFLIAQPPQLVATMAAPTASLTAAGKTSGQLNSQGLIDMQTFGEDYTDENP